VVNRWFSDHRQKVAAFVSEALLYAGLAFLARSLFVTLLAAPAVALAYRRIFGAPHMSRAVAIRACHAATLAVLVLLPCFEAKEEYLERSHVQQHSAVLTRRPPPLLPAARRKPTPSSMRQTRLDSRTELEASVPAHAND